MNRLKDWLKEQGKTQTELACELGLNRMYVNRIANNGDTPGDAFLWRFFKQYGSEATCAAFDEQVTA